MAMTPDWMNGNVTGPTVFDVEAPGGGKILLRSQEEVDLFNEMAKGYLEDYRLTRQSEKILLGALLSQAVSIFRSQAELSGLKMTRDNAGVPTGEYEEVKLSPTDRQSLQKQISEATKEIREIEKQLGIDKKSRDAGGAETTANYLQTLKRAGHRMGVHIHKRVKLYEEFAMQMRWRLRLLRNGDPEDKRYHNISEENICRWAENVLKQIEDFDKKFAKDQAKIFGGKL
jgi:hypothetical protein